MKAEIQRESACGCLLTWRGSSSTPQAQEAAKAREVSGRIAASRKCKWGGGLGKGGRKPSRRPAAEVSLRPGMRAKKKTCPWLHVACGLLSRWPCARAKPCGRRTAPILSCVHAQEQQPAMTRLARIKNSVCLREMARAGLWQSTRVTARLCACVVWLRRCESEDVGQEGRPRATRRTDSLRQLPPSPLTDRSIDASCPTTDDRCHILLPRLPPLPRLPSLHSSVLTVHLRVEDC